MQVKNPKPLWQLSFEGGDWPTSIAFVGDGRTLAAGNRSGQILVWNLPNQPPGDEGASQDEKKTPAKDSAAKKGKEAEPADWAPSLKLDGHTNGITHLRSPAADRLISSGMDSDIRFWNLAAKPNGSDELVLNAKAREQVARRKPKAEREGILNAPGVKVNTLASEHVLEGSEKGHQGWVLSLGLSRDGGRMISGDDRCLSIVWDLKTRKPISRWKGHERVWVRSAALSADGQTAFTAEYAGSRSSFDVPAAQARLWNSDDGKQTLDMLRVWTPKVKDEDRVDSYGYRRIWGKLIKRGLVASAFSPNDELLAVIQGGETDSGQVHLVEVASGKILRTISGHKSGGCDVKFSADGKYVLSCGRDTVVRICQVSDGKEVAVLGKSRGGQFKDWFHAIAISADQQCVAAADIAGKVHVWQLVS